MSASFVPTATRRWLPGLIACCLAIIGFSAEAVTLPTPDISFLLYGTEQLLSGARLYRDVIEVNPPLIFWLNIPSVLIANLLSLPHILVYRVSVLVLLLAVLALSQDTLKRIVEEQGQPRAWINVLLVLALFTLPGEAFGEREHLMFALVLPYLLGVAAQASSPRPIRRGWIVGLLAGIGFCLKPYFLPLLVALEVWLWARCSRTSRLRTELLAIAAVVLIYGLAIYALTPEYFRVVRLLGAAYQRYLTMPILNTLLVGAGSAIPLVGLLGYAALRRSGSGTTLAHALAVAAGALLLAAMIQRKGWWYHFYPSAAASVILLGVLLAQVRKGVPSPNQLMYTVGCAAALAFIVVSALSHSFTAILHPLDQRVIRYPGFLQLEQLVRERAAGRPVMMWSFNIRSGFPLVPSAGAKWSSSFPHLWLVPASYWDLMEKPGTVRFRPLLERTPAERFLDSVMVHDMERHRPELLLIQSPSRDSSAIAFRRLDFRAYFSMDPRIARMLECYRYVARIGVHEVYQRSTESGCPSP